MTEPVTTPEVVLTLEQTAMKATVALRFACHKIEALMNLPGHASSSCSADVLADDFMDEAHQLIAGLAHLNKVNAEREAALAQ